MSDETPRPPVEEKAPATKPQKKPRKLSFKVEQRLRELIDRKKFTNRVDFRAMALRFGCSLGSLKTLWHEYTHGKIILTEIQEVVEISAKHQHERTVTLLSSIHELVLGHLEGLVAEAKEKQSEGKGNYRELGIPTIMGDLKNVMLLRRVADEGYDAYLEDERARMKQEDAARVKPIDAIDVTVETSAAPTIRQDLRIITALSQNPPPPPQ